MHVIQFISKNILGTFQEPQLAYASIFACLCLFLSGITNAPRTVQRNRAPGHGWLNVGKLSLYETFKTFESFIFQLHLH